MKKGIVFSDIGGTMMFFEKERGIKCCGSLEGGHVQVSAPSSDSKYEAIDM